MPVRRTKRGEAAHPAVRRLRRPHLRRQLRRARRGARARPASGARVLMVDRYEVGERQTSACGDPHRVARGARPDGLAQADLRRARGAHAAHGTVRLDLPWTFSTFDYRELCRLLFEQSDCEFETAKVDGRTGDVVHTDRGDLTAPLIVDALGLAAGARRSGYQPPDAPLSRGLEVHPERRPPRPGDLDRPLATCPPATAGASPRTTSCGSASARSTPASTSRTPRSSSPRTWTRTPVRYQGNWIPHKLRDATEDGVFFAGDSAGHCLPLTAEGIRTALLLRHRLRSRAARVVEGRRPSDDRRCAATRAFSAGHEWKFRWMLRAQHLVPRVPPRLLARGLRGMECEAVRGLVVRPLPARSPIRRCSLGPPPARRRAPERARGLSPRRSRSARVM